MVWMGARNSVVLRRATLSCALSADSSPLGAPAIRTQHTRGASTSAVEIFASVLPVRSARVLPRLLTLCGRRVLCVILRAASSHERLHRRRTLQLRGAERRPAHCAGAGGAGHRGAPGGGGGAGEGVRRLGFERTVAVRGCGGGLACSRARRCSPSLACSAQAHSCLRLLRRAVRTVQDSLPQVTSLLPAVVWWRSPRLSAKASALRQQPTGREAPSSAPTAEGVCNDALPRDAGGLAGVLLPAAACLAPPNSAPCWPFR